VFLVGLNKTKYTHICQTTQTCWIPAHERTTSVITALRLRKATGIRYSLVSKLITDSTPCLLSILVAGTLQRCRLHSCRNGWECVGWVVSDWGAFAEGGKGLLAEGGEATGDFNCTPLHMPVLPSSVRTNDRTIAFTAACDRLHAPVETAHRQYWHTARPCLTITITIPHCLSISAVFGCRGRVDQQAGGDNCEHATCTYEGHSQNFGSSHTSKPSNKPNCFTTLRLVAPYEVLCSLVFTQKSALLNVAEGQHLRQKDELTRHCVLQCGCWWGWRVGHQQDCTLHLYISRVTFKWINRLDAAINYRFTVCRPDTAQHVSSILMPITRSLSTAAASSSGLP